jgi:hypothetical protein
MNTRELEDICACDPIISRTFLGVFPCDNLPEPHFPCCFIANTAPTDSSGQHWVVFTFDYDKKCNYFCSYGQFPNECFIEFLMDYNWKRTNRQLQSDDSTFCGEYCLAFLYFHCRNVSMHTFMSMFSSNTVKNDQMIANFIHSCYNLNK